MNNPTWEGIKEVSRWLFFFIISWVITETMAQINLIPEHYTLKLWVFAYQIPVRTAVAFILTSVGRYADKYIFEASKNTRVFMLNQVKAKGLLPW